MTSPKPLAARSSTEPAVGSGVRARATTGYTRVRYQLETRTAMLELRPARPEVTGPLMPLPDTRMVHVYAGEPAEIARRTRVLCVCPACDAAGDLSCAACAGTLRIEAWVSIRVSRHYQVHVRGAGPALARHFAVSNASDFEAEEWPNQLVHQAWYRSVPPQLSQSLRPQLDAARERVLAVHVQVFVG